MKFRGKERKSVRQFHFSWLLLSIALIGSPALSHGICRSDVYNRADAALSQAASNWSALYKHWQVYQNCDDGALAEGYSDIVTRLLAHQWQGTNEFYRLAKHNPAFGRWVIRHIDESAAQEDLQTIIRNSVSCGRHTASPSMCNTVRQAARRALDQQMKY